MARCAYIRDTHHDEGLLLISRVSAWGWDRMRPVVKVTLRTKPTTSRIEASRQAERSGWKTNSTPASVRA